MVLSFPDKMHETRGIVSPDFVDSTGDEGKAVRQGFLTGLGLISWFLVTKQDCQLSTGVVTRRSGQLEFS